MARKKLFKAAKYCNFGIKVLKIQMRESLYISQSCLKNTNRLLSHNFKHAEYANFFFK